MNIRKLAKLENLSNLDEGEIITIHNLSWITPKELAVYIGRKKFYSFEKREDIFPFVFVSRQHESRLILHYLFNEEGKVVLGQWRTKEWESQHYHTFQDKRVCDYNQENFDEYNRLLVKNGL